MDDLNEWIATLDRAHNRALDETAKVLGRGALNIKKSWRKRWSGLRHARALPYAIGYDVGFGLGRVEAKIGPDKDRRQGPLGNLIEFGSINNAPIPGGTPSLAEEGPRFERALADLAEKLLTD